MGDKHFTDIEVGAGTGRVRLYIDDNKFKEYSSSELLDLLNELDGEKTDYYCSNEILREEVQRLEAENNQLKKELNHIKYRFTEYRNKVRL